MMADGKGMPKLDPLKEQLTETQREYMRFLEAQNKSRVAELSKTRRLQNRVGIFLGFVAVGIYVYTIKAIKQERFLDDFEEPKLVEKKQ